MKLHKVHFSRFYKFQLLSTIKSVRKKYLKSLNFLLYFLTYIRQLQKNNYIAQEHYASGDNENHICERKHIYTRRRQT